MTKDRVVGFVCAVFAMAAGMAVVYVGDAPMRPSTYVLYAVFIVCLSRALISVSRVQAERDDEVRGEMGEPRPVNYGFLSRVYFGFLGMALIIFLGILFLIDRVEERGVLSEVRSAAFLIAFGFSAVAVLKLPSWGFSPLFFSSIFLSSLCFLLVYLFGKKSGAELN